MLSKVVKMNKVIPWYKMYDFVKSQPPESETHNPLIVEYLFSKGTLYDVAIDTIDVFSAKSNGEYYEYDMTLSGWAQNTKDLKTFGQIKESMDSYMDNQFRESGFEVYLPC